VSKQTREFFEAIKQGETPKEMGVFEAVKDGVQAVAPGLSMDKILHDVGSEMKRLVVQGQMELASTLFTGQSFVPYGPGQWQGPGREGGPEHAEPEMHQEQEQERHRGREM